jgi:hypothetical protein
MRVSFGLLFLLITSCSALSQVSRDDEHLNILVEKLAQASEMAIFEYNPPCWKCRESNLLAFEVLAEVKPVNISRDQSTFIKRLLSARSSYILGLGKACGPFVADYGIILRGVETTAVFLISKSCSWGRLITNEVEVPYFYNIDASALQEIEGWFAHTLSRTKRG